MCSYLQMLLHCHILLWKTYNFRNLASDTQAWSFTGAEDIFTLTLNATSRWYFLLPAAEPALLAVAAHSYKAGSGLVNLRGTASIPPTLWALQFSQGLHSEPLALHIESCSFELWKASLSLTPHQEKKLTHLSISTWAIPHPSKTRT